MSQTERWKRAWQERRRRGWHVAGMAAVLIGLAFTENEVLILLWFAATMAVAWRFAIFKCPRCLDTFISMNDASALGFWWFLPSSWHHHCSRCGLAAGELPNGGRYE
jgi:hypothetical protein